MDTTIHLQPSFHYDVEYLRPYEYYRDLSIENLEEAARLLATVPDYAFNVEQTILLEEFFERHPDEVEKWRQYVREGRVDVSPGMYVMPDTNMPGGEALIRQFIIGQRFLEKTLGATPTIAFMADCMGHNAQFPQIAKSCGYVGYAFVRSVRTMDEPSNMQWEGLDKTRLPSHWMCCGYHGLVLTGDRDRDWQKLGELTNRLQDHAKGPILLLPSGGDFNYPDARMVDFVAFAAEQGVDIRFSTFRNYFQAVDWRQAPVYRGERNPASQGIYSSRIWIKQQSRYFENRFFALESLGAYLLLSGQAAPRAAASRSAVSRPAVSERVWKAVLRNQFHDNLWGSIIDACAEATAQRFRDAATQCRRLERHMLAPFSSTASAATRAGTAKAKRRERFVVFNPTLHPRAADVLLDVPENFAVSYADGTVPPQQRAGHQMLCHLQLPACSPVELKSGRAKGSRASAKSSKAHKALHAAEPHYSTQPLTGGWAIPAVTDIAVGGARVDCSGLQLPVVESPYHTISFSPAGAITSLRLKENGAEYVNQKTPWFNDLCFQTDNGDLWQLYESPYVDGGPFGMETECLNDPLPYGPSLSKIGKRQFGIVMHSAAKSNQVRVENDGDVCTIVTASGALSFARRDGLRTYVMGIELPFVTTTIISHHSPLIRFRTEIKCALGRRYRIRAAFPTAISGGKISHEIPFGFIERPEGEFPAQNWMAYEDAKKGLCLFNKGLPGNNTTQGVMMLSLLRSVAMEYKGDSDGAYEEGQEFVFEYAILPYAKKNKPNLSKIGLDFNSEPIIASDVSLPSQPPLSVQPENILCSACYVENGELILRLWESLGRATQCTLQCPEAAGGVEETDVIGSQRTSIPMEASRAVSLKFRPFEIKTLRLALNSRPR